VVPAGESLLVSEPKVSDLIRATFHVEHVWVEREGKTTRGKRPVWLDWPCVRGDEIAQPMWLCKCGVENLERATSCEECGRKRP
jgi:hypothetical protein